MNDNREPRRNWRMQWLGSIQEFADGEAQHRRWLDRTNTNPHYSFVEYMCCYFDNLCLSDRGYDWAVKENLISLMEAAAVAEFHQIVDAYHSPTNDYDHDAILADPAWAEVVEAAKRAQAALLCLIGDVDEQRSLTEA
ncbi:MULTISPECIES: hypothetical protein [unclassified Sphingomonas]|uniref:hypothetical protein n=1 Tax=unclassified Sphingomonas TaxID=196159 RepID=UPI00215101ED|nr:MULTISPECIES: hypothetical protein [unclassified Sphingomonas]MCR5871395.1 hypothetical protein [Sphingomonas sp. J344]UUY00307.1 hypothetical protein LRS08_04110 [Sphingomonas sp. J315]